MSKKQIHGADIFYKIVGKGSEPLVLLNGISMTADNWKEQIGFFSERYKILLHDYRGQLLSGNLPDDFTVETHLQDIENLVSHTECEKFHLAGMGYGANLALWFAVKKPECLRSLTLISPHTETGELHKSILDCWITGAGVGAEGYYTATLPWNFSDEYLEKNKEYIKVQSKLLHQFPSNYFQNFIRLCEAAKTLNIPHELGKIKCPVLFISGEKDLISRPDTFTLLKKKIKSSKVAVVKNAGHAVLFEKPELVNTLMDNFLSEQN